MSTVENKVESDKKFKNRYERMYLSGSMLFVEGQTGSRMFIIRSGKIRILKKERGKSIELTVLGAGSVLGELTLLDRLPYNVTAEVTEDAVVTIIDEELFKQTLQRIPAWLGKLLQSIVRRLRGAAKKASEDVVQKSIPGVIRVLLLLDKNEGWTTDEGYRGIDFDRAKEMVQVVTGIEGVEADNVFLHLTIKEMILICKDSTGSEYIRMTDSRVLSLYMNYLRAHECGSALTGENFSEEIFDIIKTVVCAGEKNGKKSANSLMEIDLSTIKSSIEKGENGEISDSGIDQLVKLRLVFRHKVSDKKTVLFYNPELLKRLCLFKDWISVFKEEIIF